MKRITHTAGVARLLAALAVTALLATSCGGGAKAPAVAKMIPADAAHAVIVGDLKAILKDWNAMAKRLYPLWNEEAMPALGALMALMSEDKLRVNVLDPEDLVRHGIDPSAGAAVWFDDPDRPTFVLRYTDEAAAESLIEDLLKDFGTKEKLNEKGYRIQHYYTDYMGFAFAMVDGFLIGTYYQSFGDAAEKPDLGDWAKRAFLVDAPLAELESFAANTKLLAGKNVAILYHFNPPAYFSSELDRLEREMKKAKEKGALRSPSGAPGPSFARRTPGFLTSIARHDLMAKKMPMYDMEEAEAPEPMPAPPPDDWEPPHDEWVPPPDEPYEPDYDPWRPSPESIKRKMEELEAIQERVEWLSGVTGAFTIESDAWRFELVIGLTPDGVAEVKEMVPETGPDTGGLRKDAVAWYRVAVDGRHVLELLADVLEDGEDDPLLTEVVRELGIPRDTSMYADLLDEWGDYFSATTEVVLLPPPPPETLENEIQALRAVAVGLWTGGKAAEDIADFAKVGADAIELESRRSTDVSGISIKRYVLEVPPIRDDRTMDLHLGFGAQDEFGVAAVGEGVVEDVMGAIGPAKTRGNDGVFFEFALHPHRIPMKGYPIDNWAAVAPLAMTYFAWLESLTMTGALKETGVVLSSEMRFRKM